MPFVSPGFSLSNVTSPGIYSLVNPPAPYIVGKQTGVMGAVFTGSWGPTNQAVNIPSLGAGYQMFGNISAASITDLHDGPTAIQLAFTQSLNASNVQMWGVRVSDGTDAKASGNLMANAGSFSTCTLAGTWVVSDLVTMQFTSTALTGSPITVSYTAGAAPTPTTVAAGLAAAINANSVLSAAGVVAANNAGLLSIMQPSSLSPTAALVSGKTSASGTITTPAAVLSTTETVIITGTKTTGDTVGIIFTSSAITGSPLTKSYTVLTGDTIATLAAGLAAVINLDTNLSNKVTAFAPASGQFIILQSPTSVSPVVTYAAANGGGATEVTTLVAGTVGAVTTAFYTGTGGNSIQIAPQSGNISTNFTNIITGFGNGPIEYFQNLSASSPAYWSSLATAVNSGLSGIRGPSNWVTIASTSATPAAAYNLYNTMAGTPVTTSVLTLAGGTDGRSVTSSQMIGSDTVQPKTGIYALRSLNPAVNVVAVIGLTDTTKYPAIQTLVDSEGMAGILNFPLGTSTSGAITTKTQSAVANDPNIIWPYQWITFFDSVNQIQRTVAPDAVVLGALAALPPQNSPTNTFVQSIIGTERWNPNAAPIQFSVAELGNLTSAGILVIGNPLPAGSGFGFLNGVNSSGNATQSPIEYTRLTNYLATSLSAALGPYLGKLQTPLVNDPLRASVVSAMSTFLSGLGQMIVSFSVQCDLNNNLPATIAQHQLFVSVLVQYPASVQYVLFTLQGGTNVVTVSNQIIQSPVLR